MTKLKKGKDFFFFNLTKLLKNYYFLIKFSKKLEILKKIFARFDKVLKIIWRIKKKISPNFENILTKLFKILTELKKLTKFYDSRSLSCASLWAVDLDSWVKCFMFNQPYLCRLTQPTARVVMDAGQFCWFPTIFILCLQRISEFSFGSAVITVSLCSSIKVRGTVGMVYPDLLPWDHKNQMMGSLTIYNY